MELGVRLLDSRSGSAVPGAGASGTLSTAAGSSKIDHPLDPDRTWLSHSFVESPDMMNVHHGTVGLDARGEAVAELPEWFGAPDRDVRYQLTALEAPAPSCTSRS